MIGSELFTFYSDISTHLGEEPYKNMSAYHVVSYVGAGCRMPKPESCSDDM